MRIKVFVLAVVVDGKEAYVSLHSNADEAISSLRENYDSEGEFWFIPDDEVIEKLASTGITADLDWTYLDLGEKWEVAP